MRKRIYDVRAYQTAAMRTAKRNDPMGRRLAEAAMGMAGEAGEVADIIKKHLYHGHPLDVNALLYELGDELWYIADMCDTLETTMDVVMTMNVNKLQRRYPDGFSSERSINREEGDE